MMETDLARQLEGLFHEVGEAHHQAYIETDGADPEWPLWYADYLRERLVPLGFFISPLVFTALTALVMLALTTFETLSTDVPGDPPAG